MTPEDRKAIESQVLDMTHNDSYMAEFYLHKIIDPDNPTLEKAKRLANERADKIYERTGKYKEPDYTPDNLKRLGATQTYKKVPYVKIRRKTARDYISRPVTDEHKQQFPTEWAKFKEREHEYFRERRHIVRTEKDRPNNRAAGGDWQGQGVAYTPSPYTITFG